MTENERFGLVFAKTGSINSGMYLFTQGRGKGWGGGQPMGMSEVRYFTGGGGGGSKKPTRLTV
jgi:hypothetical protein